jgi:hypothetical protein
MTMQSRTHQHTPPTLWQRAKAVWLALALVACGGGVDSGGTGATSSYASGPITGFGSVIVNGVRFDDSLASISDDDGTVRQRGDLRLGMSVEIRGSAISTDATGASVSSASSIAFGSEILGPVESVDPAARRLVVLGQTIESNAATVFDNLNGGLAALRVGDVAEVYALFNAASGTYTATRVERKAAASDYRLRGVVSNLDVMAKTFNLGRELISYAAFTGTLPANLANGNFVRIRLQTTKLAGAWPLTSLKDGSDSPRDSDEARLEGVIGAFTSATQFSVNGVAVNAGGANPPAGLGLGVRVEVRGIASGGVLQATEVKLKSQSEVENQDFELRGLIGSVDVASTSFVLRGVTVSYSQATRFDDGTAANLLAGADVEARGMLSADGTRLVASRIRFR